MEIRTGLKPKVEVVRVPRNAPRDPRFETPTENTLATLVRIGMDRREDREVVVFVTTFYRTREDREGGDLAPVSTHVGEASPKILSRHIQIEISDVLGERGADYWAHRLERDRVPADAVITETRDDLTLSTTFRADWYEVQL